MKAQASFELRVLDIVDSPYLQNLPELIAMFSHLEELYIRNSLEMTDTTSLVQSLKQLGNLRLLLLEFKSDLLIITQELYLSKCRDSYTSSRMDSLETIILESLQNISTLVISGEMCPRLQTLEVKSMNNLKEIELEQLERLNTLLVYECGKLEAISGFSSLTGLQKFKVEKCAGLKSFLDFVHLLRLEQIIISECPELQSVQGVEKLPALKSLIIEVPNNRYAWARNYIHRLRRMPVKKIILIQKAMDEALSKLNASLFSEVIDARAVSEIERGEYDLEMKSSSNEITIYALLVTSKPCRGLLYSRITFESGVMCKIPREGDQLITALLTQHVGGGSLKLRRINKGIKATVKVGEEGKAFTLLQRFVD